jgi:hypothetical protein
MAAFVKERLDEEEAKAKAHALDDGEWVRYVCDPVIGAFGGQTRFRNVARGFYVAARSDPGRVLREVEAGRRILARHQPRSLGRWQVCGNCRPVDPECPGDSTSVPWPCPDARDLAVRWSDHPACKGEA